MKTLYLLRHAKAEPGSKTVADQARVLAVRGQEASAVVGAYMRSKSYLPAFALCSPARRTQETLARVEAALGNAVEHRCDDSLYLAPSEEILRAVQAADDAADSLLVVGHNPGMHHIALLLAQAGATPLRAKLELKYPTCALAVLKFKGDRWAQVAPASGILADFITPEDQ